MKIISTSRYYSQTGKHGEHGEMSNVTLKLEYRCRSCVGVLEHTFDGENYRLSCGKCGGTEIVHEEQLRRERIEMDEIIRGLPDELRSVVEAKRSRVLFPDDERCTSSILYGDIEEQQRLRSGSDPWKGREYLKKANQKQKGGL